MDGGSSKFDWQTDSEEGWELTASRHSSKSRKRPNKWHFIILGLLLIVLMGTVAGVILFLGQRADGTEQRLIAEINNSHNLLLKAVDNNDIELYSELLSKRKITWRSLQEDLLRRQLVLGRTSFGFLEASAASLDLADMDRSIQIGADLQTAEVVDHLNYSTSLGKYQTQTVTLERVFHYQREGLSWKYTSPPDEDVFWGKWSRIELENITVIMPQRDEEFGQLLSDRLNSLVGDLCSETDIECPADFHLQLKLDRQTRSLLHLGDSFEGDQLQTVSGQYALVLPAPTLVGRPIDDSGSEVLYKSYASWVAAVLITSYMNMGNPINDQLFVDYLSERELQSPLDPDKIYPRPAEITLQGRNVLPGQDILMLCSVGQQLNLWRYDPVNNRWSDELADVEQDIFGGSPAKSEAYLHRSSDIDGVLLSMHQMEGGISRWRTYLWRDQVSHLVLDEQSPYFFWPSLFLSWMERSHERITVFRPTNDDLLGDTLAVRWFDVQDCRNTTCELQSAEGIPFWSPDGQFSIIFQGYDSNSPFLSLGDENGQLLHGLGIGFPVGWLDADHFAYLRISNDSGVPETIDGFDELVVIPISGQSGDIGSAEKIISASDLGDEIDAEGLRDQLKIDTALAIDDVKNGWAIVASSNEDQDDSVSYVFEYYSDENIARIIAKLKGKNSLPVVLGQRAGYLMIMWQDDRGLNYKIFDVVNENLLWQDNAFPYDWSDDGAWLIYAEQGRLRLIALESGEEIVIPYDLRGCYSAVWADRQR